jgi:hypothetical protein
MTTPKTTAVDWLLTELARRVATINSEPNGIVRETMIDSLLIGTEQAREMEREQMEDAWDENIVGHAWHTFQDYYNETYGKSE